MTTDKSIEITIDGAGTFNFELSPADVEALRGSPLDIEKMTSGDYGLKKLFWDRLAKTNQEEFLMFGFCNPDDGKFVLKDDVDTDSLYEGIYGAIGVVVTEVDEEGNRSFNPVYARDTAEEIFENEVLDPFMRSFYVNDIEFEIGSGYARNTYLVSADEISIDWAATFKESYAYEQAFNDWIENSIDEFDVVDIVKSSLFNQILNVDSAWIPMFTY